MDNPNNDNWREILSRIEGKIDQLESDVKKINHQIKPVWWKRLAKFIINNFFTFLTLASLFLIAWKAWIFYQTEILVQLESIKNITETLKKIPDTLKDLPESMQNVKDSVKGASDSIKQLPKDAGSSMDSIKGLLNSIKF